MPRPTPAAHSLRPARDGHLTSWSVPDTTLWSAHRSANATLPFELVARTAGVSRSWLYSQPDIRDQIQQLRGATRRAPSSPVPATQRASDASLLHRLQAASERNRTLAEENRRLHRQLAEALGQLRTPESLALR